MTENLKTYWHQNPNRYYFEIENKWDMLDFGEKKIARLLAIIELGHIYKPDEWVLHIQPNFLIYAHSLETNDLEIAKQKADQLISGSAFIDVAVESYSKRLAEVEQY